jgi:hypothetical protein
VIVTRLRSPIRFESPPLAMPPPPCAWLSEIVESVMVRMPPAE